MQWVDLKNWNRNRHFDMFKDMAMPHYNFCADVNVAKTLVFCKSHNISGFVFIIHQITRAANSIENFRYRIRENNVCMHETVHPSFTVLGDDELYYHCTTRYKRHFSDFEALTTKQMHISKSQKVLLDSAGRDDVMYMSCVPWIKFTSASHAMDDSPNDSIPRFYWGKYEKQGDKVMMPFSVQVHHGLVDGLHVGRMFELFQQFLDEPESALL